MGKGAFKSSSGKCTILTFFGFWKAGACLAGDGVVKKRGRDCGWSCVCVNNEKYRIGLSRDRSRYSVCFEET